MIENKLYSIISLSKQDIIGMEKCDENGDVRPLFTKEQVDSLDEGDMEEIARKLSDDYCEQLYWQSLEIITNYVIERKIYKQNDK
jgi:hypothetical protein